jgi:hypothetical protein
MDYKCFIKTLLIEQLWSAVAKEVIGRRQAWFIKGRNILEVILALHEVLHELRRSKEQGFILQIDSRKHMIELACVS